MEIRFVKMNPTQNMTILVESEIPRERQPGVAAALMDYSSVYAEQVGFIEAPEDGAAWARLQMAGGEFCGNATMSLAALLAMDRGMRPGERRIIPLEVSGAEGLLQCGVEVCDSYVRATVEMPPPLRIERQILDVEGRKVPVEAVCLSGITHAVVPVDEQSADWARFAEQAVRRRPDWVRDDAMGILLYDEARCRIDPLVAVYATGTTVWERGCGSGTAALGAWLAHSGRAPVSADVAQPGGTITVRADWRENRVSGISITGNVRLAARGTAYIEPQ